jgi:hypothetical protein
VPVGVLRRLPVVIFITDEEVVGFEEKDALVLDGRPLTESVTPLANPSVGFTVIV